MSSQCLPSKALSTFRSAGGLGGAGNSGSACDLSFPLDSSSSSTGFNGDIIYFSVFVVFFSTVLFFDFMHC